MCGTAKNLLHAHRLGPLSFQRVASRFPYGMLEGAVLKTSKAKRDIFKTANDLRLHSLCSDPDERQQGMKNTQTCIKKGLGQGACENYCASQNLCVHGRNRGKGQLYL